MQVTILRGISGAGKSTWAREQAPEAVVVSADYFFTQPDGSYDFQPEQLGQAHAECFQKFLGAAQAKAAHIVVDNTNISAWELSPYVLAGRALGYTVEVLTLQCDPEVAISRKQLVHPDKVRRLAQVLEQEQKRFPRLIAEIHRVVSLG